MKSCTGGAENFTYLSMKRTLSSSGGWNHETIVDPLQPTRQWLWKTPNPWSRSQRWRSLVFVWRMGLDSNPKTKYWDYQSQKIWIPNHFFSLSKKSRWISTHTKIHIIHLHIHVPLLPTIMTITWYTNPSPTHLQSIFQGPNMLPRHPAALGGPGAASAQQPRSARSAHELGAPRGSH